MLRGVSKDVLHQLYVILMKNLSKLIDDKSASIPRKILFLHLDRLGIRFFNKLDKSNNYIRGYLDSNVFDKHAIDIIYSIRSIFKDNKDRMNDRMIDALYKVLNSEKPTYGKSKDGFLKLSIPGYMIVLNETSGELTFFNDMGKFFYSFVLDYKEYKGMKKLMEIYKTNKDNEFKDGILGGRIEAERGLLNMIFRNLTANPPLVKAVKQIEKIKYNKYGNFECTTYFGTDMWVTANILGSVSSKIVFNNLYGEKKSYQYKQKVGYTNLLIEYIQKYK